MALYYYVGNVTHKLFNYETILTTFIIICIILKL